ncbi:TPA: hypothetical protein RFN03_004799 [Klebsiella aerogenes]|nr:hypothetical protein [Klebsiella aerogenes]HDU4054769.1 hypothetical protein [Klebsiella aerogenes]
MFQVSAGVFFEIDKIEKHEGTFIFYSNVDLFFPLESDYPFFKVKKIDGGGINCYLVDYILLTEKPDKIAPGVVVRAGDQDFIQQFILLWEFYFDCVARLDKEVVKNICTQLNLNKNSSKIVLEIAPYLVELNRNVNREHANEFIGFVKHVVNINRVGFKSITAALKIISDSKVSLSTNFDLTYSMLVYALESLAQKNDGYKSCWEDYDQKTRTELDNYLCDLSPEISDSIRGILIDGKQFKLQKRFKEFIKNNIEDDYFYENNRFPIRRSYLDRALDNLYKMRSSFVHELKPLDVMISRAFNPMADYLVRFGEPYFSYSGLIRLLKHVINNYCRKNRSLKKETINWVMETSSVIVGEVAAEHWAWDPISFTANSVAKRFSAYLEMLNKDGVINLQNVIDKIETIFDSSQKEFKNGLLHFYYLYNAIHNGDKSYWKEFVDKRARFWKNDIYWYSSCVYLYESLSNEYGHVTDINVVNDFVCCFNKYNSDKFKSNKPNLPVMTEVAMLVCAANSYFKIGMYSDYKKMGKIILGEISSVSNVFDYVKLRLNNSQYIDLMECFKLYRGK